ncbi:MAG: HAMP domain-containing sensor histidine kinase [Candidatus Pacebacteria bacterium]|nr:HAMP domain-containing sensor histidine kinase [Candidatus Paceibacterota bacterium]
MDRFWKQFAGSVTGSKHNVFLRARLRLTALYVLIVAIIVIGFSIFLYQNIARNLTDAIDDDFASAASHHHFVEDTLPDVRDDLILADVFILVVTAGFSFFLAGKTLKPIQQSVEAQKAFAENASHELRTPLAVMKNDIEVYLREITPNKELTQTTMKSNLEEINHMSNITEDLLLLARLDNKIISESKEININDLVKNTVLRMESLATSKNIKLTYSASEPLIIHGVKNSLERVVLNIIQNAIDHTKSGGSITVEVEKENSYVLLRIADTGFGIAPEKLPNIFKRFYKGDSTGGTGLGLSIVKGIIDQHEGQISIESILGKGTTVNIRLPIT